VAPTFLENLLTCILKEVLWHSFYSLKFAHIGFILVWLGNESMAEQNFEQDKQILKHVVISCRGFAHFWAAGFSFTVIENVS
jgi:hypothetical protein